VYFMNEIKFCCDSAKFGSLDKSNPHDLLI